MEVGLVPREANVLLPTEPWTVRAAFGGDELSGTIGGVGWLSGDPEALPPCIDLAMPLTRSERRRLEALRPVTKPRGSLETNVRPHGEREAMAAFSVARLDEITEIDNGQCPFRPVRHHFGILTFGINAMTARADGDRLINEHEEKEPESGEELYVVMSGHAWFELDGETQDAPAGTFVHVPAGIKRTAFAREAGTTVVAIGGGPAGKPYEPNGWELFAPLFPLFESGDYELGADRAQALIADDPPYSAVYYNTACFESRAGRIDAALAHLRRAVELLPALAELARDDEDLVALRDHSAFAQIVGG